MKSSRGFAAALALCAAAVAGCGLGPGKDEGDVTLTVTRDYGTEVMLQKTDSIRESDTVIRVLDRNADITTRYGGGFVQSIDGLAGGTSGGRRSDWFFYVNGIESQVGSAEYDPSGGDRIWWDYRDWTAAMRVPAVVGSWPEPFVHGFHGERWPTVLDCRATAATCESGQPAPRTARRQRLGHSLRCDRRAGRNVERCAQGPGCRSACRRTRTAAASSPGSPARGGPSSTC